MTKNEQSKPAPGPQRLASESATTLLLTPELNSLRQRAAGGSAKDLARLASWSAMTERESKALRERLQKKEHDFETLFEILSETSACWTDVRRMQTYLMRTLSGHFGITRVMIMRQLRKEDCVLSCSASQGAGDVELYIPLTSGFYTHALNEQLSFTLKDVPDSVKVLAEVKAMNEMMFEIVVPLVQDVDKHGAQMEGVMLMGFRTSGKPYDEDDLMFLDTVGRMFAINLRNEARHKNAVMNVAEFFGMK